jgi:hypothetical protein
VCSTASRPTPVARWRYERPLRPRDELFPGDRVLSGRISRTVRQMT